jgi:hypothetical protein
VWRDRTIDNGERVHQMSGIEGLLLGRVLGDRYRIEEVIGRGGMGAVYRAVDERLGRQVAVKVITVTGGTDVEARERIRARFLREARAAAALPHHPNVVPVYDYGSDAALGLDYLVMELLRGSDLATYLGRSGPPPLATGLRILYEAARGLAVGHRAGLIHRDVKPGNIFLTETGPNEIQVRMVDFGIAKLVDDEDTASQLTQDGRAPHSPAFASPEQLRGLASLTPASDVFSMGAVGFQLLTGERPFSESDRNRMSLGMPVEVPSPRHFNPAIPEAAAEIVKRSLGFDAADRFADAEEMAKALDGALRGMPDVPIAPYPGASASAIVHRPAADDDERTQLMDGSEPEDDRTLLAPAPMAAGAGGAAAPRPRQGVVPPRRRPPPPEPGRGAGGIIVWLLVLALLGGAGYWIWSETTGRPATAVEQPELPEAPPPIELAEEQVVEEEVGTQPELDALVHNQEGLRLYRLNNITGALQQFELAVQLSPENPQYAHNYGVGLRRAGEPQLAAQQFERALAMNPTMAASHYNLGLVRAELGDTEGARASLERAAELSPNPAERGQALRALQALERQAPPPPAVVDTMGPVRTPPGRVDTIAPEPQPAG